MNVLEKFVLDFEQEEVDNEMYFSTYYIPYYYQESDNEQ